MAQDTSRLPRFPRLLRLRNDQVSGFVLFAIALFVIWQNRSYPLGSLEEPGPGYTPLIVAVFLGVVGLVIALSGARTQPLAEMTWSGATRAWLILAACAAATYALEPLGYRITILALLVFFLGVLERRRPLPVIFVSVGFSLLSFYIIGTLLRVPLPLGPFGW
jgi:putative tricarboxylic transport membrane protein